MDERQWSGILLSKNTKGENRVVAHYDAVNDMEGLALGDDGGHGTHVTSVLASSFESYDNTDKSTGSYHGVAPDANLVVVRAFASGLGPPLRIRLVLPCHLLLPLLPGCRLVLDLLGRTARGVLLPPLAEGAHSDASLLYGRFLEKRAAPSRSRGMVRYRRPNRRNRLCDPLSCS